MESCFEYVKTKNLDGLVEYLKLGSINIKNEEGQSLLDFAIIYDFDEAFDLLIKNYIDINSKDNKGNSALIYSILYNRIGYFKRLVREHADLNAINNKNESPIMIALNKSHYEMAKILFDENVDLSVKNANDENIYFSIVKSHDMYLLESLLDGHMEYIKSRNYTNRTLLHQAVMISDLKIAEYLLKNGIMVNVSDNFGETPVFFAIRNKDYDMIVLLLRYGALLNKTNNFFETPFDIADLDTRDFLEFQISGVRYSRYLKKFPLHTAVQNNDFIKVKQFATAYNLQKKDEFGLTPLEYAKGLEFIEIENYLEHKINDR